MSDKTCRSCEQYYQHYAISGGRIFRVYCGHCPLKKSKKVAPDTKACEHYAYGPPDEAAFVKKEFLSKTLLEHVLQMDLLPRIEEVE